MEKKKEKTCKQGGDAVVGHFVFILEREHLLSRFTGDRTVGFLRAKKQSSSTH